MVEVFGATSTTDEVLSGINLSGRRILVTGVSAGLGVETARAPAAHGADVVGAARDLKKAERATAQVHRDAPAAGGSLELIALDLASLKSVRACADELLAKGQFLDALIANAGVMATPFGHTADGFETQFGTNHLGHFVFVNQIAPRLRKGRRLIIFLPPAIVFPTSTSTTRTLSGPPTNRSWPTADRRPRTSSSPWLSTDGIAGAACVPQLCTQE